MKAEMHRQNLRGRRPVRADHRLCADDEPVRTQSAIFIKTPKASLGLSITVFLVRMRFSSVPKTRLARAARNGHATTVFKTSYTANNALRDCRRGALDLDTSACTRPSPAGSAGGNGNLTADWRARAVRPAGV
jgi:hypothetical protein